jgi:Sulfotransferase domain
MALKLIGAGLGRTGTNSLKVALEELLGGPCYHMFEVIAHPNAVPMWQRAVRGEAVDWDELFDGYAATVDWPACAFWRDIASAYPDAPVLLSTRADSDTWWKSFEQTIVPALQGPMISDYPELQRGQEMVLELFTTHFTADFADREAAVAVYERHCEEVRSEIPAARLIEWRTGEGWEPICAALGLPAPATPFPHENAAGDFEAKVERSVADSERALTDGDVAGAVETSG